MLRFSNRSEAGRVLAGKLSHYEARPDVVILALPRGGVPVAYEIAERLNAPLDVFVVRKLGLPGHEEFALGAIASGGASFFNQRAIEMLRIPQSVLDGLVTRERRELERRERVYRKSDQPILIADQTVILVDDGLATGASMRAAVRAVREKHPSRVVVAVPVAAADSREDMLGEVDEFVCLEVPEQFYAVGSWYDDFGQIGDDEVRQLLERATKFQQVIPA